ncbi:hypothetical protein AB0P36_32545 [Streptomyces flavidovirens]|uniref:hypothetical protein n=1 Tax=Streptomyces flavidovirens TaxID=67298 RepID=UPI0034407F01
MPRQTMVAGAAGGHHEAVLPPVVVQEAAMRQTNLTEESAEYVSAREELRQAASAHASSCGKPRSS